MNTSDFEVQDLRAYDADPLLGQRLAALRSQLHMDVNALAAASDVPADMIVAYESGAALPDPAAADDLAEALDVSVEQFMAGWRTPEEAEEPMVGPIAGRIRVLRASRALSREDLAQLCNVTLDQVDDWESGRWIPSREQVARICRVFGITRDRLMMNNALQLSQQLQQTLPRRERKPARPERPDLEEAAEDEAAPAEAEEAEVVEAEPEAEARPSRPGRRPRKDAAAEKNQPSHGEAAAEPEAPSEPPTAEKPEPSKPAKRTRRSRTKRAETQEPAAQTLPWDESAQAASEPNEGQTAMNLDESAAQAEETKPRKTHTRRPSSAKAAKPKAANKAEDAAAPAAQEAPASGGAPEADATTNAAALGERIKTLRKQRKMTQKDLAAAAGTSTGSISKWEAGAQPRAYILPRLAKALGVSVAELRG